jgi:hypothetical protein
VNLAGRKRKRLPREHVLLRAPGEARRDVLSLPSYFGNFFSAFSGVEAKTSQACAFISQDTPLSGSTAQSSIAAQRPKGILFCGLPAESVTGVNTAEGPVRAETL